MEILNFCFKTKFLVRGKHVFVNGKRILTQEFLEAKKKYLKKHYCEFQRIPADPADFASEHYFIPIFKKIIFRGTSSSFIFYLLNFSFWTKQ